MKFRILALVLVFALAFAVSGCVHTLAAPQRKSAEATASPSVTEPVHLRMMPFQKRMAVMPEGMPLQIPVMDGTVVDTSAPVPQASWLYTLDTSGTVESVSHWYSHAYSSAGWNSSALAEFDGDALTLHVQKHRAESDLRFTPGGPDRVRVEVSIGLGVAPPKVY